MTQASTLVRGPERPISRATLDELIEGMSRLIRVGRQASHRVALAIDPEMPVNGMTMLALVQRDGAVRAGRLACELGLDASVISRQVAVLERLGLLLRGPDPEDRRASLVSLTTAGVAALARAGTLRITAAQSAMADWTESDAARVLNLIDRLSMTMTNIEGAPNT